MRKAAKPCLFAPLQLRPMAEKQAVRKNLHGSPAQDGDSVAVMI
jgi:hypothetical protein